MNPGKLDILGTIQYDASTTKNAAGETVASWTTYCTLWLKKMTISAKESVAADQIVAITTEEFMYRTTDDSGITPKMRLSIGSEVYDIIEVSYIDRMYSKLVTTKRDND